MRTRSVRGGCGGINSPHEDPASAGGIYPLAHEVRFSARERSETRSLLFKSAFRRNAQADSQRGKAILLWLAL